ncbi:MAG: ABC transporter permease [Actinobacteria bacterium]|nr:ABC transporter permease [Actinomycetota bacterium]
MLSLRVALRFIAKSRFQSLLIVFGIAVGIAVQVFVGSLITSLQASLLDSTVGSSPHVILEPIEKGGAFAYTEDVRSIVRDTPAVVAISPQIVVPVLATKGEAAVPLIVRAGEFAGLDGIYKLSQRTVEGEARTGGDGIVIGKDFAEAYSVAVGDTLPLALADGTSVEARVSGIFDLGVQAVNEGTAFADSSLLAARLGLAPDEVNVVETQIDDVFSSSAVADEWRAALPQLEVGDWQERNAELLTALQSQGTSSVMIQVFVVIAVMLGIASTLAISAVQKTRQIGILKALGMSDSSTGLVFLYQAGILGFAGTLLGLGLAAGLIALFSSLAAGPDSGLFPIKLQPSFVTLSAGVGISIALLSAVIPYRNTARLDPIEVIQGG